MQETKPVRVGEELDIESLSAFLASRLPVGDKDITVEQFPAGGSNLTYLVRFSGNEYVLRRPPFGNTVKTAHDMQREFDVLSKLSALYKPAPKPLLISWDASIIGSEFYLMERRQGLIIRGRIPGTHSVSSPHVSKGVLPDNQVWGAQDAEAGALARAKHDLENSQEFRLKVCKSFVQNLADLHSLDPRDAGLDNLGKPEGYNRRQVEGWSKRYFAAKTDEWPRLEKTIIWLNDNIPVESGASLVHND